MLADMALRRTNALTMEEDDRVREAVRKLVAEAGSQRALSAALAAKGLRVSQQTINRHLNGDAAGREFAQLVAATWAPDQVVRAWVPIARTLGQSR